MDIVNVGEDVKIGSHRTDMLQVKMPSTNSEIDRVFSMPPIPERRGN